MEETTWKSFRIWEFADPYKYKAQLITPYFDSLLFLVSCAICFI
jgi:hypothetical protein